MAGHAERASKAAGTARRGVAGRRLSGVVQALQTLAPIVLVIALGALLAARGHYSAGFFRDANRLTYWFGLPALLFLSIARAPLRESWGNRLFLVVLLGTAGMALAAWLLAAALRLRPPERAAVVAASFRANLAYVGLPVIVYALAAAGVADRARWAGAAALCLGPMVLVYNLATVLLFSHGAAGPRVPAGTLIRRVVLNPLILSSAAGLLVAAVGRPLPGVLDRTLQIPADMALPLALLALGAAIEPRRIRHMLGAAVWSAAIKTLLGPLLGFALASALGLGPEERLIALVFLACPTAVATYVMAAQLGADERLTGGALVLSTLVSALPLTLVLLLTPLGGH